MLGSFIGLPLLFAYPPCYPYDMSTLLLFTLSLGLMARRRWGYFMAVYPLVCLSKETAILLTVLFVMHYGYRKILEPSVWKPLALYQVLIFAGIKALLAIIYANYPGHMFENHFRENLVMLSNVYSLPGLLSVLALAALAFNRWKEKPLFLRDGLAYVFVPLVLLMMIGGVLYEVRVLYEAYPIALLLMAYSAAPFLGIHFTAVDGETGMRTVAEKEKAGE